MNAVPWYAELNSQYNFRLNFICGLNRTTWQTYDMERTRIDMAWHGYGIWHEKIYLVYTNQYQTSKRYANHQKDVLGIYQVYLFWFEIAYSCHMPCLSLSCLYPFPRNAVIKRNSAGNWIAVRLLHTMAQRLSSTTRFICHRCSSTGGLLCQPLAGLWLGHLRPASAGAASSSSGAAGAGAACAGAAGAGAGSSVGSAGRGSAGVWGFLGVLDSARALGAVTPLAPAMPSTLL